MSAAAATVPVAPAPGDGSGCVVTTDEADEFMDCGCCCAASPAKAPPVGEDEDAVVDAAADTSRMSRSLKRPLWRFTGSPPAAAAVAVAAARAPAAPAAAARAPAAPAAAAALG